MAKKIRILVKPNARHTSITTQPTLDGGEILAVSVTSPPIDGKANKEVIDLLSKHFDIPKGSIDISSGRTSKYKTVTISTK